MGWLLEKEYLRLYFCLQRLQWENYAYGAGHGLDSVNSEIYALLKGAPPKPFSGRKGEVWEAIRSKGLVENHPEVAALRNKLDDWDNYLPEAEDGTNALTGRISLANNMRADVLGLLKLRDKIALELGFSSYVDLVLGGEDLSRDRVVNILEEFLSMNLGTAQKLIKQYGLRWPTWFSDLDALGADTTKYNRDLLMEELLDKLGFAEQGSRIRIVTKSEGFAGYTGVTAPREAKMLVKGGYSFRDTLTFAHELGHALTHTMNEKEGLFLTWTTIFDESMACTMEQIAARLWLKAEDQTRAEEIWLLESVRCSLSFLFELALWQDPSQAEALYTKYYGALELELGPSGLWALDSFRSLDPVYVHNYALGDLAAKSIVKNLIKRYGEDYRAWGEWLKRIYYQRGREAVFTAF